MMNVAVGFAPFIDEPKADTTSSLATRLFFIRHSKKEPKNDE
jgi:hypothetical protein